MMEKKVIVDQKEYLKKYLASGDDAGKKKKKKKKLKVGPKTVKIVDDDIDLKNMRPMEDNEFDIFIDQEDAPQIAGVVDERGPVDFTDKRRWKIVADSEGGDLTITSSDKEKKQPNKGKNVSNHDLTLPRKQKKHLDDDLSSPRRSKISTKERSDVDSDLSPPRKESKKHVHSNRKVLQNTVSDNNSHRQRKGYDSDLSPPRKNKKHRSKNNTKYRDQHDSDLSPPRKNRKDSESDLSPPRRNRKGSESDLSPPRRVRKDSDSDLSPPRKNRKCSDSDLSPPRKNRKVSDSDLSPPRRKKKNKKCDSDLSPPRQSKKHKTSYSDIKKSRHNNFSPQREHRHRGSHASSHKEKHHKHSDSSYKLNKRHYDSNTSSSHKKPSDMNSFSNSKEESNDFYKSRNSKVDNKYKGESKHSHKEDSYRKEKRCEQNNDNKRLESRLRDSNEVDHENRMKKTLDGKKAGLQDARALREETEAHKKREAEQFSKLSKEVTGVGQAAVMRDSKTGRKRNLEAEAAEEREKQKQQAELNEKYAKWGAGLKQVEDREEKLKDDLYEMSKPLSRYADDPDLDKRLREQEREGDPMLEYIKQKQIKEGKRKPDQPRYEGSFMPNRFGIKPGHRWDGVDRSNGYEKRWFEAQNAKVARQEEAYKWSTSDM